MFNIFRIIYFFVYLLTPFFKGLSPSAPKKLKFFPGLIFVDESSVIKDENTSESIQEIKEIMQESGFPYHMVKLEEVRNL